MALIPLCKCGRPINHYVDGVQQKTCTSCADIRAALAARRIVAKPPRPFDSDARALVKQIDDLLADDEYAWAEEMLTGIRTTVSASGHVTVRQQDTIDNIEGAGHRGE